MGPGSCVSIAALRFPCAAPGPRSSKILRAKRANLKILYRRSRLVLNFLHFFFGIAKNIEIYGLEKSKNPGVGRIS